jgi:hypothetical protein
VLLCCREGNKKVNEMFTFLKNGIWRLRHSIANFEEDLAHKKDDDALPIHYKVHSSKGKEEESEDEYDEEDDVVYKFEDPETNTLLYYVFDDLPEEVRNKIEKQKEIEVVNSNGTILSGDSGIIVEDDEEEEFEAEYEEDQFEQEDSDYSDDDSDEENEIDEEDFVNSLKNQPSTRITYVMDLYKDNHTRNHTFCYRDMIRGLCFIDNVCFIPVTSHFIFLMRADMDDSEYERISKSRKDVPSFLFAYDSGEVVLFTRGIYEEITKKLPEEKFVPIVNIFDEFMTREEEVEEEGSPVLKGFQETTQERQLQKVTV